MTPSGMETLDGKVAVVTGGGSGIGRSMVLALAEAGASVAVADIHMASAVAVAAEARARGVAAEPVACDVADRDQVGRLADVVYDRFGRVEVLCNNAGVSWRPYRNVMDATLDDWRFIMGVNLYGIVHALDAFLPRMRKQEGRKHIVNTASLGGLVPIEGHTVYSASKAAAIGLSEAMAGELAPHGFGVTILCPGQIPTNLGESTTRIRGASDATFEPVDTPTIARLATFAIPSVDPVGRMVCRAILTNQLYLHTAAVPDDLVSERVATWFGPGTVGVELGA